MVFVTRSKTQKEKYAAVFLSDAINTKPGYSGTRDTLFH